MPLYQPQGEEGFYLVARIPGIFLWLGRHLRRLDTAPLIALLPGVRRADGPPGAFTVDLRIARFLVRPFFHLLGYRVRYDGLGSARVERRDLGAEPARYRAAPWNMTTVMF